MHIFLTLENRSFSSIFSEILSSGASVNFYMFFGGTNFGFTAGANYDGPGNYKADLTSYDYDAPMNEWGDPTDKFYKLRDVIREFVPPSGNTTEPEKVKRIKLPSMELKFKSTVLGKKSRELLGTTAISSVKPKSFEELDQYSGFVLYETQLPKTSFDPNVLTIPVLHDRAIVMVNNVNSLDFFCQNVKFRNILTNGQLLSLVPTEMHRRVVP